MNLYVGGFAPDVGSGTTLGNNGNWPHADPYRIYSKLSNINAPSSIFVFLDMREDSVNWSNFMTEMDGYSPPDPSAYAFTSDLPGMYHLRACCFSFADGHSELHKWLDGRTTPPLVPGGDPTAMEYTPSPGNVDVAWLQDHSTRPK